MNVLSVCFEAHSFHLEATSFHLIKTSLLQTVGTVKYQVPTASSGEHRACESGWEFKGVKILTKGQSVRPNPKPCGPRRPVQGLLCSGLPCTSEHVYTQRVYYNHVLQDKQALFFESTAKKKPLLPPPLCSERDTQTIPLPQSQNPKTGWLRKRERKMTGDKLRGGKGSYFLWAKWKAWEM